MNIQLLTTFAASCKNITFFGLKPWYYYLPVDPSTCDITSFDVLPENGQSSFVLIALALIDDLLMLAGLITIGYIIYGGFLYVTSQGSPDTTQKAQGTIQNALIGLVISIMALAIVRFLGSRLG